MKGSLPRKIFIYTANALGEKQMEIHCDLIHLAKTQSNCHLHLQSLQLKDVVSPFL